MLSLKQPQSLKDFLEGAMKHTKLDKLRERAKPVISQLTQKLQEAIDRAKDLSVYGKDYLIYHQELSTLPLDTARFILHVPYLLSIRSEPDCTEKYSVVKIKIGNLLNAVRDTFACLVLLDNISKPIEEKTKPEEPTVEENPKEAEVETDANTLTEDNEEEEEEEEEGESDGKVPKQET